MPDEHYTWIDDSSALTELGLMCNKAPWLAIDTESNSMFCYRERICLIQVNAGGELFMIDPLALSGSAQDLEPLRTALENPEQPCYLHGGEYDVCCFKRDYNLALRGVWDSQQAASFLGLQQTGYGNLVNEFCGVELDKSFSQYNWGQRPIDGEALDYAINDVIYLPQIVSALQEQIEAQDLVEELSIANQAVMDSTARDRNFHPAHVYRLKGMNKLHPSKHPVLLALFCWRDELAREMDQPAGRIINAEALIQLAQKSPTNFGSLKRIRLKSWLLRDHGRTIIDIIKAALREAPTMPERERPQRTVDASERQREKRLKDWRRSESERRQVPYQVVLPARALSWIKEHGCEKLEECPQLGDKRIQLYGDKLRSLCI